MLPLVSPGINLDDLLLFFLCISFFIVFGLLFTDGSTLLLCYSLSYSKSDVAESFSQWARRRSRDDFEDQALDKGHYPENY